MWLGSDFIGVVFPSETPSVKPDTNLQQVTLFSILTMLMWTIWKTVGGKRSDITDPDWLESGFTLMFLG